MLAPLIPSSPEVPVRRIIRRLGVLFGVVALSVTAFAVPGDLDPANAHSNTFELEWPRGSGQMRTFPEVDRVEWFPVAQARAKLLKGQLALLDQLMADPRMAGLREG